MGACTIVNIPQGQMFPVQEHFIDDLPHVLATDPARRRHLQQLVAQVHQQPSSRAPRASVWRAATSKAEPRRQQDWILKRRQGGRARPLAACGGGDTLLLSPATAGNETTQPPFFVCPLSPPPHSSERRLSTPSCLVSPLIQYG
jgi:hypothetical protein